MSIQRGGDLEEVSVENQCNNVSTSIDGICKVSVLILAVLYLLHADCQDLDRNKRVGRNFRFFLPIEAEAVDIVTREDLRNSQIINSTNALPARTET